MTPPPVDQLRSLLPVNRAAQAQMLTAALTWLVDNLDRPQVVTAGCARLGPAVAALGVPPERLEQLSTLLMDTSRAAWVPPLRPEERAAWYTAASLAARWMAQGATSAGYEPPFWTGTVIEHDRRRGDLAVVLVRTYLPYPYLSGQHAVVQAGPRADVWRPCWLATPPTSDNMLELHVRSGRSADPVGTALVEEVRPGDRLRLRPAAGPLVLDPDFDGELLLLAEDTGLAPMRALLTELRQHRDPRRVHLVWLVNPNEEPYDLAAVSRYADDATTITPVRTIADLADELTARAPWPPCDVFLAGTPTGVAGVLTALAYADAPDGRIRVDEIGSDD